MLEKKGKNKKSLASCVQRRKPLVGKYSLHRLTTVFVSVKDVCNKVPRGCLP